MDAIGIRTRIRIVLGMVGLIELGLSLVSDDLKGGGDSLVVGIIESFIRLKCESII